MRKKLGLRQIAIDPYLPFYANRDAHLLYGLPIDIPMLGQRSKNYPVVVARVFELLVWVWRSLPSWGAISVRSQLLRADDYSIESTVSSSIALNLSVKLY
jgi:hypothetical protein